MILHITHTDLDGYGCLFVSSTKFSDLQFYNLDYSETKQIPEIIEKWGKVYNYDKIYITDLNLKEDTIKELNKFNNIVIVDHHIWDYDYTKYGNIEFHIDNTKCATKAYYELVSNLKSIKNTIELINIYDTWKTDDEYFGVANILNDWFYEILKDNKIFDNKLRVELIITLLFRFSDLFEDLTKKYITDYLVEELENTKSSFIRDIITDKLNEPISNKMLLAKIQLRSYEEFTEINNFKISNISSDIFQIISSLYLDENHDKICINFQRKANDDLTGFINTISIRSRNNKAREIAKMFGGGGHPNAAGAIVDLSYEELIKMLKDLK